MVLTFPPELASLVSMPMLWRCASYDGRHGIFSQLDPSERVENRIAKRSPAH